MQKKLTTRQGISLVAMFVIGSTLYSQGAQPAKQDTWVSILLALAMAIPVVLMYCRILALFPGLSLYDIFYRLFGRFGGAVLTIVYILFFLHMEVLIVRMFTHFNRVSIFPNTPIFALALPICILGSWLATLGFHKLGKAAATLIFLIIAALLIAFTASITAFDFTAWLPFLEAEPSVIGHSAMDYFSIPLTQTVVLLVLLGNTEDTKVQRRSYVFGIIFGTIFVLLSVVRSILVLGGDALGKLAYTSYLSASVIRIDSFIQRIETIISLSFLVATLIKLSVYCFAAKEGVVKLFPKVKVKWLIFPTAILVAAAASMVLQTTEEAFAWMEFTSFYAIGFQVALPVVVWIWGEIAVFVERRRAGAIQKT